ncbi:unnamed protein product [Cylindrotheca closterium]|uniref:TPL/SMU1 LisH-like dimerisation domain-containing protein n=1 Tax=Cylindrotheca closterium TaxID=2856 RepID=A0AAD2G8E4_9STRA|nr:unnamed protein product [Cylindrotheca closterium]
MGFTTSYSIGGECTIDSADILRLILGYLTSQGLHRSALALRQESGVGLKGLVNQQAMGAMCLQGDWGSVLKSVSLCEETPAQLHEQVILELVEAAPGNMNAAFSVLKLQRESLDAVFEDEDDDEGGSSKPSKLTKARSLEQKLAAVAGNPTKYEEINQRRKLLYGNRLSKQDRRQLLADQFQKQPQVPLNRLPILLQQAMKWQSHTGQLPWMREVYQDEGDVPIKVSKKKRKRKHFDLVMGSAAADNGIVVGDPEDHDAEDLEPIPQEVSQKVKFGKGVTCESATFCSKGLITSSSDGLIEIWNSQCTDLNMADFPYQKQSVMGHESAVLCLKLSNDGELLASGDDQGKLMVWKLSSGKCLRQFLAHNGSAISCIDWSPDSSRILTGSSDGKCRELGLRSQKILQEYLGHTSYIHSCQYVLVSDDDNGTLSLVLTGSADGCVRVWQQGNCIRILQPQRSPSAKSLVVDATQLQADQPAIHTVLTVPNHDQQGRGQNLMLVAPRSSIAYLMTVEGRVVQTYQAASDQDVFLAACISHSFVYLATQKGECLVFHLFKGTLEKTIYEFAAQSTSKSGESGDNTSRVEITQLLHHPFRSMLGAFSNDKTQRKGVLSVWK